MADEWTATIRKDKDGVKFIYDGNVDRYQLIGLMEVELDVLKQELVKNILKGGKK
jgi:hypothetical protein